MTTTPADSAPSPVAAPASPSLVLAHDSAINYAFQQNAIPVIKELHFQNDATARKDLTIRVSTEPAFAASARSCERGASHKQCLSVPGHTERRLQP
ncbi:hypothetical protein OpiT1DRAFT_03814 [Opitutaceae bacterium TAV1]|nr:hypothetical protein OpiT1DRAFT_03814 [Opitutaceae bacterium TAV1]